MFISARTYHSIDILYRLSKANAPLTAQSIAEELSMSNSYLDQLFKGLKDHGLVDSVRGQGGGYMLKKPLSEITFCDVAQASETDFTKFEGYNEMKPTLNGVFAQLKNLTLDKLASESDSKHARTQ